MTTQRKQTIVDETVIVVADTRKDQYNNLFVTDAEGNEVKISEKRAHLHPIFQKGKAVQLGWAEYMNRPYVAEAQLVGDIVDFDLNKKPQPAATPDQAEIDSSYKPSPQEVGMCVKEIGELIRTHTLSEVIGKENCPAIVCAYRTNVLKGAGMIDKVDISKYPAYKSEDKEIKTE